MGGRNVRNQNFLKSGTYNRTVTLTLKDGVSVFGGFAGTEASETERDLSDRDSNGIIEPWEFTNETLFTGSVRFFNYATNADAVVDGITMTTTASTSGGSVIALYTGNVLQNSEVKNSPNAARGVVCLDGGKLLSSYIHDNVTNSDRGVVSIYYNNYSPATVSHCRIEYNKAQYGGGIYSRSSQKVSITNNLIIGNEATKRGGGVYLGSGSNPPSDAWVINNTIMNNIVSNPSYLEGGDGDGSGIFAEGGDYIYNNVITGNTGPTGCKQVANSNKGGNFHFQNNAIQGLAGLDWTAVSGTVINVNNIDLNGSESLFSAGYIPVAGGLLENAGDKSLYPNYVVNSPELKDLKGDMRVQSGQIDIGAYEYNAPAADPQIVLTGAVVPYDGLPHGLIATTTPTGLPVTYTYNGSPTPPSAVGIYTVVATVDCYEDDIYYYGTATAVLEIANVVTVTFNGNGGGTPDPMSKLVTINTAYGTLATVSRTGYDFAGWFTEPTGGTQVTAETIMTTPLNHMLYAHWTPKTYTLTFDGNGGMPYPTSKTVTFDAAYGTLATVYRAGYDFNGWFTAPTGGTQVTAASIVTTPSNHTLYAHWTPKTYTLTFDGNGGGAPYPTSKTVTFNAAYGTLATVYRTGYDFNGWFTAPTGGTRITAATIVTTPSNHTLYAQWLPRAYLVTFDSNGGSAPSPASTYVTYGVAYGPLPVVTRPGYNFAGWYTSPTSGIKVTADTLVATASNHTLYAHWTKAPYTHFFYDVNSTDWFYDPVMYVVNAGLFNGTNTNMFSPASPMTRAMIVTVLYRLEGMPAVSGANPFNDVAPGMWYTDAVIWSAQNGIVTGYNANTFGTNDSVTREQLVTILYRYAKYKGYDLAAPDNLAGFTDAGDVSPWALTAMRWAVSKELVTGVTATSLDPTGDASRAQVAAILMRFIENNI